VDCPACGKKTISFSQWCNGLHSISWTCPHCMAALRMSTRVVAAMIVFAFAALGVAVSGIFLRLTDVLDGSQGHLFVLGGLAILTVISAPLICVVARSGAYRIR
jgi:hypothetical protein